MKIGALLALLALLYYKPIDCDKTCLLKKIAEQEAISKAELEKLVPNKFKGYEDGFIGTGSTITAGNLTAGIMQGKKDNVIYDILLVFKPDNIIVKEAPNASYHLKDNTVIEEYKLGRLYTAPDKKDTACIKAYIETIEPYQVDTLNMKFSYNMAKVLQVDSFRWCGK